MGMLRSIRSFHVFILGPAVMLAVACGRDATPTPIPPPPTPRIEAAPTPTATLVPTPTRVPLTAIITLESEIPAHIDADVVGETHSIEAVVNFQEGLLEWVLRERDDGSLEVTGELKPNVAERWEISNEGETYTFFLRRGVLSQYGNELTAQMLKEAYDMLLDRKAIGNFFLNTVGHVESADNIEVVGDYTLRITASRPDVSFLATFAFGWMGGLDMTELNRHITEDDEFGGEWLRKNPAGFGPYTVARWVEASEFVYEFQPNYFGDEPKVRRITARQVPEPANRLALLLTGRVDIARDLERDHFVKVRQTSGFSVTSFTTTRMTGLGMNATRPPFDDVKVRQAVSYAVPYKQIIDTAYKGLAEEARSIITSVMPHYTDQFWIYNTDPEKARQLLADAGYPSGFDTTLLIGAAQPEHEATAILLRSSLADVGINVTIEKLGLAAYFEVLGERESSMHIFETLPIILEVSYMSQLNFICGSFFNYTDYCSEKVDELTGLVGAEFDDAKRRETAHQLQKLLIEDAPQAILALPGWHIAHKERVSGVAYKPQNNLYMKHLRGQ